MEAKGNQTGVSFPHVIERRNGRATIYRVARKKGGRTYVEFRVAMFDSAGKRSFSSFSDFKQAVSTAEARIAALGRGLVDVTTLSGAARLDYLEARRLLPSNVTLAEAAQSWTKAQQLTKVTSIRVPDLVEAFATSRESSTRKGKTASADYARDIRRRLGKFAEAFQVDAGDVTAPLIEEWLDELQQTGRNRVNTLRLVRTLLRWAQKRGHLPDGPIATDKIDLVAPADGTSVEIFTPDELAKLFSVARPGLVPYLALGAFAGCRTAEILRLDWRDVKVERGFIEVGADKAKTASRRLIPALPSLAAWLAPLRKAEGRVVTYANLAKQVGLLSANAGVPWKHNALRHSFISYRLAEVQSVDKVALEAGNSPSMIFKHYRELVTPEQAQAWFSVLPKTAGTIIAVGTGLEAQEAAG